MRDSGVLGLVVASTLIFPGPVNGQVSRPVAAPDVRTEGIIAGSGAGAVLGGAGISLPAGIYARLGLGLSTGAAWDSGGVRSGTRAEATVRGLFDPLREFPYGISIGGGISASNVVDGRWRPYLTLFADVEGQRRGRYAPVIQLGIGGGARLSILMRSGSQRWR